MPFRLLTNKPLKNKRDKIRFDVHLAEHCNLNCCCCEHFSSIAEPEFPDVEEFRRDFERMGEIFSHECDEINLMGGEPLLNPDVNTLMKIARDNFQRGTITLLTNGLLLTRMDPTFWRTCHDNNIIVSVTPYPIKLDIDTIRETAEKFSVMFKWWGGERKVYSAKNP